MNTTVTFYNVKSRQKEQKPVEECEKIIYTLKTSQGEQKRYAIRHRSGQTSLTKFLTKEDFDSYQTKILNEWGEEITE